MALAVSRVVWRRCAPRRPCAARCAARRAAPAQEAPPSGDAERRAKPLSGPEVKRRFRAAWDSGDLRDAVRLLPSDAALLVDAELTK